MVIHLLIYSPLSDWWLKGGGMPGDRWVIVGQCGPASVDLPVLVFTVMVNIECSFRGVKFFLVNVVCFR